MVRESIVALLAMVVVTSAIAMPVEIDTDGDGVASLAEIQAFYPDVTDELFREIDLDEDGYINDEEFLAAIGTQLLPDPVTDS